MALPQEGNGTFVAVAPRQGSKAKRVAAIGFAVIVACAALVALVGQASEAPRSSGPTSLVALAPGGANPQINALAREFLEHGAQMTQAEAYNKIKNWNHDKHLAELMHTPARTQMLAAPNGLMTASQTQALAGDSLLCAKRDKIIELFDQLLAKLGGEELSANITMGKVTDEFKEAMTSWLDSESTYRLTVEKAKEATEGATFARNEYEKWHDANKQAKKDLDLTLARHAAEREDLAGERQLIKLIMRLIGVLHDVKATEKSFAAGGRDSVKDPETGVSDPYASAKAKDVAQLKSKFAQLQALAAKTKLPGASQKLAMIDQHLAVYSETEEVARILKEMLDDIESRLKIIDTVDEQAKKLVEDTEVKMVEWEKQLVALSNAADKVRCC